MVNRLTVEDVIRSGIRLPLACVIALRKATEDGHDVYVIPPNENDVFPRIVIDLASARNVPSVNICSGGMRMGINRTLGKWKIFMSGTSSAYVHGGTWSETGFWASVSEKSLLWDHPERIPKRVKAIAYRMVRDQRNR